MEFIEDARATWPDHTKTHATKLLQTYESFTEDDLAGVAGAPDDTCAALTQAEDVVKGQRAGAPKWYVSAMHRSTSAGIRPLDVGKRYAAW